MALVDYRLNLYARLWDLLIASDTIDDAFYEQNRIRLDEGTGKMQIVGADAVDPNGFPKLSIFFGNGRDSGHPAKYAQGYDGGAAVEVIQDYTVKLTFENPDDLLTASPLIAEVRAAILRGGSRLGGSAAGFGYVRLSGPADATIAIGPDPDSQSDADRLIATFNVSISCVLLMSQLTGAD